MRTRISLWLVAATLLVSGSTRRAQAEPSAAWGDGAIYFDNSFSRLAMNNSEAAKRTAFHGSGVELRFMMPIGWGAYYRANTQATNNRDGYEWKHIDVGGGFSRRLLAVGSGKTWGLRAQLHFDVGFLYSQLATHETCKTGITPFATSCDTITPGYPGNAAGVALGLETRFGGEVGIGPLGLGLDLGVAGYREIVTGGNSREIPGWFAIPSALLKVGLALPF